MSMTIVHHVLGKSQTQGSARTFLLTLALHANDCCGVAWVSDRTLRQEVNVSRQRCHELKNVLEDSGELVIVERPGSTNLYFVAWQGQPVGSHGSYRAAPGSTHEPGCPLRRGMPITRGEVSGESDRGVSGTSDTQVSEESDRGCQAGLTQKTIDNYTENEVKPVSLSPDNGANAPQEHTLSPARLERLGLTPGSIAWQAYMSLNQTTHNTDDRQTCVQAGHDESTITQDVKPRHDFLALGHIW
jgi:hypothetical protein